MFVDHKRRVLRLQKEEILSVFRDKKTFEMYMIDMEKTVEFWGFKSPDNSFEGRDKMKPSEDLAIFSVKPAYEYFSMFKVDDYRLILEKDLVKV